VGPTREIILGIDLGTTYSTAAALIDGELHFALDPRGEACVPSVVHFPKAGAPVVGHDADRLRGSHPESTVHGIKRLIGRPADSPEARLLDANAAFRIKPQPSGEAAVQLRTGTWGATEVAALILRYLRELAEKRFGRRIGKAVVTVPVTAGETVRAAMVRCGRMAGLEVLRIATEPCAGALAHGLEGPVCSGGPMLVYDFGGGTFDATVVVKCDGKLRVLSVGGDNCLGGDDFDTAFARQISDQTYRAHGCELTRDAILRDRLWRQCEQVKRALSFQTEARLRVPEALRMAHGTKDLDVIVRRGHLDHCWAELVRRSLDEARQTVVDAQLDAELGGILMIGGTTYVPQVRAGVLRAFPGVPSLVEQEPQTAVARGAAWLAAREALLAN
jgi:molecular chaperone DnaK